MKSLIFALMGLTWFSSAVSAQQQEAAAAGHSTPLRVQVTLSRFEGERKIASMPYTMLVNAGERDNSAALRMGVAVPVPNATDPNGAPTMRDIGTNMDCVATLADNGRFRLMIAVNNSSVYETETRRAQSNAPRPGDSTQLVRSFTSRSVVVLRDGESTQSLAATDPVTGEIMKIDVALTVVK